MSVSILWTDPQTDRFCEICVSVQRVWNEVWEKAISERGLRLIGCVRTLHIKDMDAILDEFRQVKDYALTHDISENDRLYVSRRIDDIIRELERIRNEVPETETLDMG